MELFGARIMWTLWMERDSKIFEEKEMESTDMFEKAKFTLWASTDKALKEFPFS